MPGLAETASELGLDPGEVRPYGANVGKVPVATVRARADRPRRGRLILVTAATPTHHGEGKTVTAIGTAMALRRLGHRSVVCLRQPSLGPVFGVKGGATGGGKATVEPQDLINLGFTGDLHAVEAAHNLLAALVDNHLYHGNEIGIDPASLTWPRTLDVEDRALRRLLLGPGGYPDAQGHAGSFVIAAASEVTAIVALARDYPDLEQRLSRVLIGRTALGQAVRASDLRAAGAMAALLREALEPNLVAARDGTPALVHGGPFGNIAHGTASLMGIHLGLAAADYCVVEAGFATELGAEKFVDIVSPAGGFAVDAAVLVVSIRGLRHQGGLPESELEHPDEAALSAGLENLAAHMNNLEALNVQSVVTVNRFPGDSDGEIARVARFCAERGVPMEVSTAFTEGASGCRLLAERAVEAAGRGRQSRPIYGEGLSVVEKVRTVATRLYGADTVEVSPEAEAALEELADWGEATGPVCIAKTALSISDDPKRRGRPKGYTPTLKRVSRSAGAGFTVAFLGDIETMPGLPRHPLAEQIELRPDGTILGLH